MVKQRFEPLQFQLTFNYSFLINCEGVGSMVSSRPGLFELDYERAVGLESPVHSTPLFKGSWSKRQNESAENMFTIASEYFAEEPKTKGPKRRERRKDYFHFLLIITNFLNYRLYFKLPDNCFNNISGS